MVLPNTEVRFSTFDKRRLAMVASGGIGLGAFAAAGKLALLLSNPVMAVGAMLGLGGIAFRQAGADIGRSRLFTLMTALPMSGLR